MDKKKKEILNCVSNFYNPNKTTLEIGDIFSYFNITLNDILDYHQTSLSKFVKSELNEGGGEWDLI